MNPSQLPTTIFSQNSVVFYSHRAMLCPAVILLLITVGMSPTSMAVRSEKPVRCHCNPTYLTKDASNTDSLIQARLAVDLTDANRILAAARCSDRQFCTITPPRPDPNDNKANLRPVCAYVDLPSETDNSLAHTIHCAFLWVPANETDGCLEQPGQKTIIRYCSTDDCNNKPIKCKRPIGSAAVKLSSSNGVLMPLLVLMLATCLFR